MELIEIEPTCIAEQMTLIDHESLKTIVISELLYKNCIYFVLYTFLFLFDSTRPGPKEIS